MSGAVSDLFAVIEPGLSTTVQDGGRPGYARFGVSGAGAVDAASLAIANALVGNPPDAAALELTLTGGVFEVLAEDCAVALAGAEMPMRAGDRPLRGTTTQVLRRGERLALGMAERGLRAYLAVAGGLAVPPVLGSRATHARSRLGGLDGRALRAGDRLPFHPAPLPPRLTLQPDRRPYFGGFVRVLPGPQADLFGEPGLTILLGARYRVSARSDRMACGLDGPALPLAVPEGGYNIVSDGIVPGAIQVPGHGRPLVLLADRQTTGGYPKIATVLTPDLGRIGQRRPGEGVRFRAVSADEAEAIYLDWRAGLDALPSRLMPAAKE